MPLYEATTPSYDVSPMIVLPSLKVTLMTWAKTWTTLP